MKFSYSLKRKSEWWLNINNKQNQQTKYLWPHWPRLNLWNQKSWFSLVFSLHNYFCPCSYKNNCPCSFVPFPSQLVSLRIEGTISWHLELLKLNDLYVCESWGVVVDSSTEIFARQLVTKSKRVLASEEELLWDHTIPSAFLSPFPVENLPLFPIVSLSLVQISSSAPCVQTVLSSF